MATPTFDTIEAQASYGIGLQVGQQLSESGLQGLLPEALVAGIADALEGNQPQVPVEAVHRALREIHERADAVRRERFQAMAADGQKYLDENREKEGVNSTESGLAVPRTGPGRRPDPGTYRPRTRALHRQTDRRHRLRQLRRPW